VYDAIEASNGFYASPVEPSARSNMNIPFTIPSSADLEKAFISEAASLNMVCAQLPQIKCLYPQMQLWPEIWKSSLPVSQLCIQIAVFSAAWEEHKDMIVEDVDICLTACIQCCQTSMTHP